ncbi:glycoside hydrolase family 1 protein [Roseomonas sp. BN140053]|uniref:glycoside hydrolase family 1 protein n=1 Tax=Roseomonas sp. BN140053 TaxID=3391898 RepID=UPI0039EBFF66
MDPTRRTVLLGAAAPTLSSMGALSQPAGGPPVPARPAPTRPALGPGGFPAGFSWGVSASAPQTESAKGRGRSNWDDFAAQPGRIADGSDPSVNTRFEDRYEEDIGLLADAGLGVFCFSVSWPRLVPGGSGPPDPAGLDLYDRMVDAMLARGVQPWPLMQHWDVPSPLPGAWLNRDIAPRFAEHAAAVAQRLGDRVRNFVVFNEPATVAFIGHSIGIHPPGLRTAEAYVTAMHHQNLAQGLGFQAMRAVLPSSARLGTTLNIQPVRPATDSDADRESAAVLHDAWNLAFLDPLFGRPYPARFERHLAPLLRAGDLEVIAARPDFLGQNFYQVLHAAPAPDTGLGHAFGRPRPGLELTDMGWSITPDGLGESLRLFRDTYGNPDVVITEMGASFRDPPGADTAAVVEDPRRIAWLRAHLEATKQAIAEGCNVSGALAWTLTDNWEWAEGFGPTFGLVRVDRATLRRTPRRSLEWLGRCARANAVV